MHLSFSSRPLITCKNIFKLMEALIPQPGQQMAHLDLPSIKQVEHAQGVGRQMQLFFSQVPLQI